MHYSDIVHYKKHFRMLKFGGLILKTAFFRKVLFMSYEKVQSFSFLNDFTSLKMVYASSNVYPLQYFEHKAKKDDDETKQDFVKKWIKDFIDGSLQFNNKNNLLWFTIIKTLKEYNKNCIQDLWLNEWDFGGKYIYDEKRFIYQEENGEIRFKEYQEEREMIINDIVNNIMASKFKKDFSELKSQKYVLTNGSCYIVSNGKTSFKYAANKDKAKIFNGLQKELLLDFFAITKYKYQFELI